MKNLSPLVQQRIEEGLADVEAGRVKPIQEVLNRLMAKRYLISKK